MNSGSIVPMIVNAAHKTFFNIALVILSALISASVNADLAFKHGAVMARSIVLDANKQPILVEYNEDGTEGQVISIPSEYATQVGKLRVITAYEYKMEQARLKDYKDHHVNDLAIDAEVMSREEFLGQSFPTADGQSTIQAPALPTYVKSVLVRGRSNRITTDPYELVLLSFAVDLSEDFSPPDKGSILLDPKGGVIKSSSLNIAPRVGFFGDPQKAQEFYTPIRKNDDKIFGPVKYAKVYVSQEAFSGGMAMTDKDGKYSMHFLMPYCPGGFEYSTDMWAELKYANFSPNGMPALPYYLRRQDWTYCYDLPPFSGGTLMGAMAYVNAMGIMATMAVPSYNLDIKVDVMFLSGKAILKNPDGSAVQISNVTEYGADSPDTLPVAQQFYDLDADGTRDMSVVGDMVEVVSDTGITSTSFQPNPAGKLQGVFLSSRPNYGTPHLFRQADSIKNREPNGVLKSISKEDLRKTDVLVFRESTGELVLERKGLSEQEAKNDENGVSTGLGEKDKFFFYRLMLRGPMDSALNIGGGTQRHGTWAEWATRFKLPEPYQKREADHLKSGEWVRVVVINRKTGYMGTQRIQLNDASQNISGYLSLPVEDITLSPPNLKVWAERNYTQQQGLQQGNQENNNVIGAEGAALASDDLVTIYTEWYDEEGRALPEGLAADNGEQYGLTGRLAKVVGQGQLAAVAQGGLAEFPISPGRHTQVLRIRDNLTAPEHFYIHVTGTQKNERPDFGAAGPSSGEPMDTRPKMLTPFLTPQYNEANDWYGIAAWNRARKAFNEGQSTVEPLKPQPSYLWTYRPEYQFSQYELELHEIERTTAQGDKSNMLDDPKALAGESDQWIDIFYSLLANNNDRLTAIDGPQDLVLAVGEEEIKLTIGTDKSVRFENLDHLAALNPEDFLTIRLYSNQDAGNILWQYAFETYGNMELSRSHSQARYNDENAYQYNTIDSYGILNIPLETESAVQVNLLDDRKRPVSTLVRSRVAPAGMQHVVVLRKDLDGISQRAGTDAYIIVKTIPTNGNRAREKIYEVNLTESINGEMLGQVIEHDTLIQRGSLTLKREDMALQGTGPQLDFSRSYSNESKPENSNDVLSPGWSHNHNIYVQVLAQGDNQPPYENNLPGWISATREGPDEAKILDRQTLSNLKNRPLSPSVVAVSNGGSFKRKINNWVNQRGNHGTIKQLADGTWEYRSKDGTLYNFEQQMPGQDKAFVKTITDRNGNKLTYTYTTVADQRLLLSVKDLAERELVFTYSRADNGKMQLDKVASSVGADLEFTYYPKAENGYDARVGMLKSFTRENFTETYDYRDLDADPSVNLSTVIDANGNPTRYEYYNATEVPVDMGGHARGLDEHDIVHKVFYPSTSGNEFAEIKYLASNTQNKREITDLRRNKKTYTLNALGNPTRLDEPEGKSTTFEWSADMGEPDNLLRIKTDLATNATWEYEYDAHGNLTKETDPYEKTTEQSWDQNFSVLLFRKDKNGNTFEQTLDSKGNVLTETQTAVVDGAEAEVVTKHTYGNAGPFFGALRTTTNGRSARTEFTYDDFGVIATVAEPEGSTTRYENNNRGLRLSATDANDNTTTYEYDELDRLTKTTDAENNSTTYVYDNKGNKKSEEIRDSYLVDSTKHNRYLKLAYTYDPRDRVKAVARTGNLDGSYSIDGEKTYTYDANSNLLTESDWKGAATTHTYDALNRRLSTKNRTDDRMNYSYAFNNGVETTITDYAGRVTTEFTDKLGRKTKVVHPAVNNIDGSSGAYERVMTYDNLENVIALRDENGNTTSYLYDGRNLKIKQTNADGKDYRWQYDAAGNVSKTIDEANRVVSYTYDKLNRLTQKDLPEQQKIQYSYFANGTLRKEIDPWKFETSYTYDKINQRTSVTHPDGVEQESYTKDGKLAFKKDAENRSVSTLYGPEDRIQVAVDARGRTTTNTYDENNNLVDSRLVWSAIAGPASVTTHAEYDAEDRAISQTTAQGSVVAQTVTYQYDGLGNRTEEAKPDGRVTRFQYDELNRVKRIETASVDGLNPYTLQVWDGVGNKTKVTDRRGNTNITEYDVLNRPVKITDADNKIASFTYDAVGNKLTETNRRGNITEHTYDGLNREVDRFASDGGPTRFRLLKNEYDLNGQKKNAVTDANNNRIEVQQDWRGNTLVTTLPAGNGYVQSTSVNTYDKSGFLLTAKDAAGYTTTYTYHADGKAATAINPENETTAFEYDIFGNKARITKPLSGVQTLAYDEQNRISQIADALGGITRFEYDDNNNLVRQFLPAANDSGSTEVEYSYDVLNRKRQHIQHKSDGNLITAFVYDAEGNLTKTTDAKGQEFNNTYDALNRLQQQDFPAGSDITRIVTTHDANGNVDTVTETKGAATEVTTHSYDLLDRLSNQTQRGRSITYAYDNNGNRTRVTSIGGVTTYTYDSRNRLSTVTAGGVTNYRYFANNWLDKVTHANGTAAAYTYDGVGRMLSVQNTLANGNVLSSFAYAYDDNGNRTQQIETQNGFLTVQILTTNYVFDALDRLESYTETGSGKNTTHTFTYYPSYDRKTEKVVNNGVTLKDRSYAYNGTYWLTGITETAGTGGSITYLYDDNGNSIRKTDTTSGSAQRTLFEYNSRNQLKRVAHGAPNAEVGQGTHDYNYAGMRIRHIGSERGDIEYIYDGDSILDELQNNTATLVAHYRYGDRLLSLVSGGSDQFYHYSALGTTANLTNASGEQQVAYRTDAFGKITQQQGTSVNRHVFTGQEHDEKTGLIYFGARFYDPDTARFINQDTYLGESTTPPSLHRYLYAYSNPTYYIDPNGHCVDAATGKQAAGPSMCAIEGSAWRGALKLTVNNLTFGLGYGEDYAPGSGGKQIGLDASIQSQVDMDKFRQVPGVKEVETALMVRNGAKLATKLPQLVKKVKGWFKSADDKVDDAINSAKNKTDPSVTTEKPEGPVTGGASQGTKCSQVYCDGKQVEDVGQPVDVELKYGRNKASHDLDEFKAQANDQGAGLSERTAGDAIQTINKSKANGRLKEADEAVAEYKKNNPDLDYSGKNVLHKTDTCVGGDPACITGLGAGGVNKSLGRQNKTQQDAVVDQLKKLDANKKPTVRVIVEDKVKQ